MGEPVYTQYRRSAIAEMARQIIRIENKTDYARGITCNVGLIQGGVDPAHHIG